MRGQPQFSPDGRYWWDGRQWLPVPPVPAWPPRRGRRWPWLALGAAGLVLLLGVCMVAVSASSRSARAPAAGRPGQVTASSGQGTPDASCSPQPCANDSDGWMVTIAHVTYDAASGSDFEQPEAGNVFVTMDVTFTNRTSREQHATPYEFVLQDGAGVKHAYTWWVASCPTWDAVNLTTGATYGPKCVAFEATAGRPSGLALVWTPTVIGRGYVIGL